MWIRATDSAFSHPVAADGGHPHNDAVAATKATRADGFNCETAHKHGVSHPSPIGQPSGTLTYENQSERSMECPRW